MVPNSTWKGDYTCGSLATPVLRCADGAKFGSAPKRIRWSGVLTSIPLGMDGGFALKPRHAERGYHTSPSRIGAAALARDAEGLPIDGSGGDIRGTAAAGPSSSRIADPTTLGKRRKQACR